jgi:hypothetical protein
MKPQRSPNQNLTVRNQGPNDSKVRGGDNALIGSLLRPAATTKRRVVSRCFTLFHVVSRCYVAGANECHRAFENRQVINGQLT